jgi:Tfp pilus assembly protein PilE
MKSENGRSMVEMLGVLAIIGVLSVGAIAGYSKAMMKYKLNNFSQSLSQLVQSYATLLPQLQADKTTQHNFLVLAKKLNLLPAGMKYIEYANGHDFVSSQFGNIEFRQLNPNDRFILAINLDGSQLMEEYCRQALITMQPWGNEIATGFVMRMQGGQNDDYNGRFNGSDLASLTITDFQKACSKSCNEDYDSCSLHFQFYFNEQH